MATTQTIATTLTADHRPAVQSLRTFDAEVGKAFSRLDQMNKRAFSSGGGAAGGLGALGGSSGVAARGFQELARGVEDAASVFGTSGFAGAIRASSNNLSQMASVMGGPLAGAIAGFAAAGLSMATPYISSLLDARDITKELAEQTDIAIRKSRELFETRAKERAAAIDFREERRGLGSSADAARAIRNREIDIEKNRARIQELDAQRERNRAFMVPPGTDFEAMFGEGADAARDRAAKADQLDFQLANERLELLRKETELLVERGLLKKEQVELTKKEAEIQKQREAEERAAAIRRFQEEDERERQRKEREQERKVDRDAGTIEGLLQGRLRGLGGKIDPLQGLDIPDPIKDLKKERDELREKEGKLVDELDGFWSRGGDLNRFEEIREEMKKIAERRGEIRGELEANGDKASLESRLRGVLGEADALNSRPQAQLAQVVTADSQSLLRSQYMAKEAAERKRAAEKLQKAIEDILREIRDRRKKQEDEEDKDDVNLN